jgi:hypothetical protein
MVLSSCSTDGVTLWPVYRKAGCDGQILDVVNGGFTQTFGYDSATIPGCPELPQSGSANNNGSIWQIMERRAPRTATGLLRIAIHLAEPATDKKAQKHLKSSRTGKTRILTKFRNQ